MRIRAAWARALPSRSRGSCVCRVRCCTAQARARARANRSRRVRARRATGCWPARCRPGEVLLTAHHADDQLETVLLSCCAARASPGLAAMPELTPFARRLAGCARCSRARVRSSRPSCAQRRLAFLEDPSNRGRAPRPQLPAPAGAAGRARALAGGRRDRGPQRPPCRRGAAAARDARAGRRRAARATARRSRRARCGRCRRSARRNALRFWIAARGLSVPPDGAPRGDRRSAARGARRRAARDRVARGALERHAGLLTLYPAGTRPGPQPRAAPRRRARSPGRGAPRPSALCRWTSGSSSSGPTRTGR